MDGKQGALLGKVWRIPDLILSLKYVKVLTYLKRKSLKGMVAAVFSGSFFKDI